jgi:hypothetical protein
MNHFGVDEAATSAIAGVDEVKGFQRLSTYPLG